MTDLFELAQRSQRVASWQFTLTSKTGSTIGNLTVDRAAPPTVSVDTSRALKRTLTGVLMPPGEFQDVNTVQDRVRLSMVMSDGTTWPMGWYLFTASTKEALSTPLFENSLADVHHLDLVDQLLIVDQPSEKSYSAAPNTIITDIMIVVLAGLPVTVEITPSSAKVQGSEAIGWPAGTSRLRIINELCTMIGYAELHFDNAGMGKIVPMPSPDTTPESQVIDYTITDRIYRPGFSRSDDFLDLPNRFVLIGSGASGATVVGVYNVPASAPHSATNRGYVISYTEQQQGINTQSQANAAAAALSRRHRFAYETVDFDTPPDPRHDHYNTLSIENKRLLEVSWSMTLTEGAPMHHTARDTYTGTGEL